VGIAISAIGIIMSAPASNNPQSEIRNPQSPITDSPWFWVLAFSLMALLALAVIGFSGKYGRRQSIEELKYQARSRVAEKLTAENNPDIDGRIDSLDAQRAYATPDSQLIPIWPLAVVLGLVSVIATGMLYRNCCRTDYQSVQPNTTDNPVRRV
jgi:hypothetical protein